LAAVSAFCDDVVSSGGCSGDSSGINCGSGAELVSAARAVGASPVAHLPRAVRSLVDTSAMTSRQVEEQMQRLKAQGRPPFEIDVALLRRLRPALVLSQDACAACDATAAQACAALRSAGIGAGGCRVLSLSPRTLAEVAECIVSVGDAAGAGGEARALVADLRRRQAAVASAAEAALAADKRTAAAESAGGSGGASRRGRPWQRRPRVLLLCGLDPFVLGGQWIPDLIATVCRAEDASGQLPGDPPLRVTWSDVIRFAPDLLVLSPCSRSPGNALGEALALSTRPGWWGMPAVAAREVYIADHGLFSRPGPGMATRGAEVLARLVWGPGAEGLGPCPQGAVLKMRPPEGVEEGPAAMERGWFVNWD
jgi:iron complex transport system substrate-binding protein